MKLILIIFMMSSVHALESRCGIYSVRGDIKREEAGFYVLLNKETKSEYHLSIKDSELPKIAPFIDQTVSMKIAIEKKWDNYKNQIEQIKEVERILFVNRLGFGASSLVLEEEKKCL